MRAKRKGENMYTEIVKIIEGGLQGDKEKVQNYANVLANNLEKEGEVSLSKKIRGIVENRRKGLTSLDSFATKPVDTESRMEIVRITTPQIKKETIILSKYVEDEIQAFIDFYENRIIYLKQVSRSLILCYYMDRLDVERPRLLNIFRQ